MMKIQLWKEETGYTSGDTSSEEELDEESFYIGSLGEWGDNSCSRKLNLNSEDFLMAIPLS
jgi:hypothetical protein